MHLLYLGDVTGTSRHRSEALARLGWKVEIIDPRACFGNSRWAESWMWRAGAIGMDGVVRRWVLRRLKRERYDVVFVNHGELVGPALVRALRARSGGVLHFNLDNPFVDRDMNRWRLMRLGLPFYDAMATPRLSTVAEGERRGARHMIRFYQVADEVVHRPRPFSAKDAATFGSDVSFVGTWMPERGALIRRLLAAGVKVKLFGPNWHKAAEYAEIAPAVAMSRGLDDEPYVRAIQYARIALGFLSAENQDRHTTRSAEVPAIGSMFCAQRTEEHVAMYRDGEEAVFWNDADECAARCQALLAAPDRIAMIAAAGAQRQRLSERWNEPLLTRLIDETLAVAARSRTESTV